MINDRNIPLGDWVVDINDELFKRYTRYMMVHQLGRPFDEFTFWITSLYELQQLVEIQSILTLWGDVE